MSELLPCPFCGGEAEQDSADDANCTWISCTQCGAHVEEWNTRAPAPAAEPEWLQTAEELLDDVESAIVGHEQGHGSASAYRKARAALLAHLSTRPAGGEPVAWQWRRKNEPWSLERTFNSKVSATTEDSEVRALYAVPTAKQQPPHPEYD